MTSLGIQLHTLRSLLALDFSGTLGRLAGMGYTEVEFAGYYDHSAAELRSVLQECGLAAPSAHISRQQLDKELGPTLEMAFELGHRYLVLPWLAPQERETLDDYRALADFLNHTGDRCRDAGITVAYHNHDFEFLQLDDGLPYEILLERTEPALVSMELDLYWLHTVGGRPEDYFARYPGRFELCHLKDADEAGDMTEVGEGVIDFPVLIPAAQAAGMCHFFVEHDQPRDPLASVECSFTYLDQLSTGLSSEVR